jgi:hypothetical protein
LGENEHTTCLKCIRDKLIVSTRAVFEKHKASLVAGGSYADVFTLAQAQAAALFHAMHEKDFWDACVEKLVGIKFVDKDLVFIALSEFGRKAVSVAGGLAFQQRLRDLGLPTGPNPGKELLQRVTAVLAAWDMVGYEAVRKQVVQRQLDICTAGGEHVLLLQSRLSRW